jgi:hypothetical protein
VTETRKNREKNFLLLLIQHLDSKIDEMAKMLKTLTSEMARLKMETKQPSKPTQEGGYKNPNQFRRSNNVPQIFPKERRNQEDQRVLPPLQNNAVEEVEEIDDTDGRFHGSFK